MLVEFGVENFRSFKDEVILSMVASPDSSLKENTISDVLKGDSLLRSAAVYGANASGKTNLVQALFVLLPLVLNSQNHQFGQQLPFVPFKLDPECLEKPTRIRVSFIHKEVKYEYGVSFNSTKVIDEHLYHYPNDKKASIFERTNTNEFKFNVDKPTQEEIRKLTSENVLYLSKAAQNNYPKAQEALDWFRNGLTVIGPDTPPDLLPRLTADMLKKDPSLKQYLLNALTEADLGIGDFLTNFESISPEELLKKIPELPPEVAKLISSNQSNFDVYNITTYHKKIPFNFDDESAGTKRLFGLAGFFIDALRKGKVLVVDELDTRLHYKLNLFLINLFHDASQNEERAQLIFTTHNVKLLDLDVFRRDQIWFTQKDAEKGFTELFSLAEFGERKDRDIEKAYLAGRYGAIPFIKENKVL